MLQSYFLFVFFFVFLWEINVTIFDEPFLTGDLFVNRQNYFFGSSYYLLEIFVEDDNFVVVYQ